MNISDIKAKIRKSMPVPIKMLKLLDEEEEEEEDREEVETEETNNETETKKLSEDQEQQSEKTEEDSVKSCDNFQHVAANVSSLDEAKKSEQLIYVKPQTSIDNVAMRETVIQQTLGENQPATFSSLTALERKDYMEKNNIMGTPIKHVQTTSMRPMPCTSHPNIFQTPECPQVNINLNSKYMHSVPAKNNKFHEIQGFYDGESRNTARPLIEGELLNSYSCDSKQYKATSGFSRMHLVNSREGKQEENNTKRAIFPVKKNSKENQVPGKIITEPLKQQRHMEASDFPRMNVVTLKEERREECNIKQDILPVTKDIRENKAAGNIIAEPLKPIKYREKAPMINTPILPPYTNPSVANTIEKLSVLSLNQKPENEKPKLQIQAESHFIKPESISEKQMEKPKTVGENQLKIQCVIPKKTVTMRNIKLKVKGREYMVLNVIGRGMSAEVLQVQDVETQDLRAIKRVNFNSMDRDCAKGCLDEIHMLYRLQASCIVRMFDYELKQPYLFVVMELGETDLSSLLKSVILEKNRLPFTMILHYWYEMLSAVKYIHDNGVIHSDLKPANFILVKGRLKLIDFGIASSITADSTSVVKDLQTGTLNYISPEALMDANPHSDSASSHGTYKISRKSDVWSLGCILYCMVYGVTPFQHIRNQWAKISAITNAKPSISYPVKREDTGESIPSILIYVIQKCLQHNPKSRPSVDDLLKVSLLNTMSDKGQNVPVNIRQPILLKIREALLEDEWREFLEALNTGHSEL